MKGNLLVLFGLMFAIFACSNDCLNVNVAEKNNNENNQSNIDEPEKRLTTLQDVVDNTNAGEEIDLSDYELTNYTATVNKKLTIKNGSLGNAKLTVTAENVKLEKLTDLSVSVSSRLTIADSKLSNLLIGTSGETSRSVTLSTDEAFAMVAVTNCEIENVSLDGFNSQLNITDTQTKIGDIATSTKAKVVLEAGSYEGIKDPTVKDDGEIARVDMSEDAKLSVLSIYSNPYKLEYNIGEEIDLSGLVVLGTYTTFVETFKSSGMESQCVDTITKREDEKDYTEKYDFSNAGVSLVTIVSKKNQEIKCRFCVFVKDSQNAGAENPEEKIEITDVTLKTLGTAKTVYKVGEILDLSCYQVVGKYKDLEVNLPYTSEPANGATLTVENTEIKFHYDGGTLTQTITVTLPYTVTFKDGDDILYTIEVAADSNLSQLPVAKSKDGYTFDGWYNGENEVTTEHKITGDLELTAKWTANKYTVKFNANGGSGEMENMSFVYNEEKALTANTFNREGFTFAGWATSANGNIAYTDMAKVKNLTAEDKATVILYAVWKTMVEYYVDSSGNDNDDGTVSKPFKTVQKAVDAAKAANVANDGQTVYVIYVMSDITGTETEFTNNNALINVVLEESETLNLKICSYDNNNDSVEINAAGKGRVMYINGNAVVTLENITLTGGETSDYYCSGVIIRGNGELIMNDGAIISDCKAPGGYGGGVLVGMSTGPGTYSPGKFTMSGGKISNCEASAGGGVYVTNSEFTMSDDATIENCLVTSTQYNNYGGGVYVGGGTFTMSDSAAIKNCEAMSESECEGSGGGVYVTFSGTFNMTGGEISGCTANNAGGGVWMDGGSSFDMSGSSKISGCIATQGDGGGVFVTGTEKPCTFKMSENATITDCSANQGGGISYGCGTNGTFEISDNVCISNNESKGSNMGGGGIYIDGKLVMTGGEISGNTSSYSGGGVCINSAGIFEMNNGTISGNTALNGNGVYVSNNGTFEISGGAVVDSGNDVYLSGEQTTITIAGELTLPSGISTVATITPSSYPYEKNVGAVDSIVEKVKVLSTGDSVTLTEELINKFVVTSDNGAKKWGIDTDGMLQCFASDFDTVIGSLTNEMVAGENVSKHYDLVTIEECSNDSYDDIIEALNGNDKITVSLDLSRTTGLTDISQSASFKNDNLTGIVLPDSLSSIGEYAFYNCSSLESVTIPAGVTTIGSNAFAGCGRLITVNYRGTQSQWQQISKGNNNFNGVTINYNYTGE